MGTFIETSNDKAPNMMPFVHFDCNREHVPQSVTLVDRDTQHQRTVRACCPVDFQLMATKHGIRCLPNDSQTGNAPWCEPWSLTGESSGTCIPPDRNLTSYRPIETHDGRALDKLAS